MTRTRGTFQHDRLMRLRITLTFPSLLFFRGMHNRQALTMKMIWKSLCDYDLWPMYGLGLIYGLAANPVAQCQSEPAGAQLGDPSADTQQSSSDLQISFKSLGFSTVKANLLSVPNSCLSLITLFAVTILSEAVNNRSFVAMAQNIWLLPCYIAL